MPPAPGPSVTTPETRYVNPDGTVIGATAPGDGTQDASEQPANRKKSQERDKSGTDAASQPTADETLHRKKVQHSAVGPRPPGTRRRR